MKQLIEKEVRREDFLAAYGVQALPQYSVFLDALAERLRQKLPREPDALRLKLASHWNDSGENVHAIWKGMMSLQPYASTIQATMVWLHKKSSFRGYVVHRLPEITDASELTKAELVFGPATIKPRPRTLRT